MATTYYIAKARDSWTLELPKEAQELGLQPGDEVQVSVNRNGAAAPLVIVSGEEALAIMCQIAERHKDRRITDHSATQRLLEEARGGSAYGYAPTE